MSRKSKNGFQGTVLTHLDYIKKTLDSHEKTLGKIFDKIDNQKVMCSARMAEIETDINQAKGYVKGAATIGGIFGALIGGVLGFFGRFFKGN